ncbi:M20/M25/M40 family metallo-hydrolase [Kordiimonas laminariae]|uniref:M20/M25/M40 family metallo-hydrolase n=1 Tax=Kordiimonas laminariae TaxID=2917717 RepID=UPI001FF6676B|nr:M20/M25/M40 family metallo-hydrolase [Kordiimonas laminariae]MCK0070010.1 M20/M25/M40 family metallo-hydrolase [Kordiimonas laminariae]
MLNKILVLLTAVLCVVTAAKADDKTEAAILKAVEAGMPQALSTLEKAVNINSGTMNFAGVRAVGDVFIKELDELGFKTEWAPGESFNRAGHLVASRGTKGPKILMIGHLDTVFAKGDAFQKFEPLGEGKVKGPGITDMKGGDVIIIAAMRALKAAGVLDDVSIRIVMTGDEEASGRPLTASKKALVDAAIWADIALGFEDGDGNVKTAVVARRGSVNWSLDVTGRAAHSSQIFTDEVGYGAVFEAARILNGFREKLSTVENLTFNPGRIVGGTRTTEDAATATGTAFGKNNVVAKTLRVTGGIRALSPEQLEAAKAEMHKIASENLAHTSAKLVFGDGYPPMAPTEGNYKLLSLYSKVSEDLGYGEVIAVNPRRAGAADISFAADHVEMALDGLGLMGMDGHTKDETADMESFKRNTEKAALLIYRLSQ